MCHQNSHCEYEYDYDRILIKKNTSHLSKRIVSFLLFFYKKKRAKKSDLVFMSEEQ